MSKDDVIQYIDSDSADIRVQQLSASERAALADINRHVSLGETLSDIMDYVFDSTQALFPCDRIGLSFFEDDGARVVAHWARAQYEPLRLSRGYAEDLNGSSLSAVAKRGVVRIINDLEFYLKQKPNSESTRLLVEEGVRSSMTCPLIVDGRTVGFLFRSSRHVRAYDLHQVQLHLMLAERLSRAVEKAYRLEQMESMNRTYRELIAFISHEVKNPIASIVMDARVLTGAYLGPLTDEQRAKIDSISRKAHHVLQLARDYLDLGALDSPDFAANVREVPDVVREIIDPAIDLCASEIENKGVKLERRFPPGPQPVTCQPGLISTAVINLLGNAIKYSGTEAVVRITLTCDTDAFRVSVWNEGPGFSIADRNRLFQRFSRLNTPASRAVEGTGLGLYTVWRIAKVHGGSVHANSSEGQWAEFMLEIPQPPVIKSQRP